MLTEERPEYVMSKQPQVFVLVKNPEHYKVIGWITYMPIYSVLKNIMF